MLDNTTKKNIDDCRDVLVGKVPDPKSQIEQITLALIYKFMDDMDKEAVEKFKGKPKFFTGEYSKYGWRKLFDPALSGTDMLALYSDALDKLNTNPNIPELFRNIFKNAYLPYRDPATLKLFLKHINAFEYSHSEKLGDAFEYLLSVMGSQGDAGQFRTPRHIIDFVTACVDPQKGETVLDPACGTAGFLLSAYKHILNQNTDKRQGDKLKPEERKKLSENIVGYDISPDMVRLSLANMYLHGFSTPEIHEYDTLSSEDRWNETYDVILANPPFMTPKGGIRPHKKFGVQANKAEVLFTDYIAEHLSQNGRAGIVVPNGIVATSQTAYKQLRRMLVEDSLIAVISLPAGCFNPYSGVKTNVLILDKALSKKTDKILFLKIENDGFDLGAQRREHDKTDLPLALLTLNGFKKSLKVTSEMKDLPELATIVERKIILEQKDVALSAERYFKKSASISEYENVQIKSIATLISGTGFPLEEQGKVNEEIPFLKVSDMNITGNEKIIRSYNNSITRETARKLRAKVAPKGTIIFPKIGAAIYTNKKRILSQDSCFDNNVYGLIPNQNILSSFLYYILLPIELKEWASESTPPSMKASNVEDFEIPLPPIEIQQQIVAEIEAYQKIIDGARQVVENYKPVIKIKPEWEMVEIGEVCEINPKKSELKNRPEVTTVSFVPMADLNEDDISFTPKETRLLGDVITGYTYFKDDDVLFAKVTPCFENGKAGIASNLTNGIGFGSSEYFVLRCTKKVLPTWIYLQIKSPKFAEDGKKQMSGTSGLQRIPREFVSGFSIPLPSLDEQKSIVNAIIAEMNHVASNNQLVKAFEQKIKEKINEVWGVIEETDQENIQLNLAAESATNY